MYTVVYLYLTLVSSKINLSDWVVLGADGRTHRRRTCIGTEDHKPWMYARVNVVAAETFIYFYNIALYLMVLVWTKVIK